MSRMYLNYLIQREWTFPETYERIFRGTFWYLEEFLRISVKMFMPFVRDISDICGYRIKFPANLTMRGSLVLKLRVSDEHTTANQKAAHEVQAFVRMFA